VSALKFSPDGLSVIVGGDDGFIRLWDVAAAKETRRWKGHEGAVTHLSMTPEGDTLATLGQDKSIGLWDVAHGTLVRKIAVRAGDALALALRADGKQVAAGGVNNAISRWETAKGKALGENSSLKGAVTAVACSPDGKLAAAGFILNQVLLLDTATFQERGRLICGADDRNVLLAWSGDGKTLATSSDRGPIIVWDVAAAKEHKRYPDQMGKEAFCIVYSPDGLRLAVGYGEGTLDILDTAIGESCWRETLPGAVRALSYSSDGKHLACGYGSDVIVYDTVGFQPVSKLNVHIDTVSCLSFAPDSRTLAVGLFAGSILLFDLTSKDAKVDAKPRVLEGHRGGVNSLSWSVNGRCLASAGFDKAVIVWEFVNGLPIARWAGHVGQVTGVAFHPSGRTLISASRDTSLLLWDMTGQAGVKAESKPLDVASFDALWRELASNNNVKGNDALWNLVHAKDSADYLHKKVFLVDPKRVKQYISELDSDTFRVREKAFSTLASYGRWIEDTLKETVKQPPSEEVRQRVVLLLQRLQGSDAITLEQERLRARRVIEVLEQTATPVAFDLLSQLSAAAPETDLREMAQKAMERATSLEKRSDKKGG
jgi:WD40 repeat protein